MKIITFGENDMSLPGSTTTRCMQNAASAEKTTRGTSGGQPVNAIRVPMTASALNEIAMQYQTRSRGNAPMDWSIVVSSAGFTTEERRGKARGGLFRSAQTGTTSTAGKQQCDQSTTSGGDTDSDLLHRNSPLRSHLRRSRYGRRGIPAPLQGSKIIVKS